MLLFWASLAALLVGPALLALLGHRRPVVAGLDGYVMVAVGGLILLDVLPHAYGHAGLAALAAALVGLALPMVVERSLGKLGQLAHRGTVVLALGGLAVHAVMDGMALRGPGADVHNEHLAMGVVLHRLPLGLLVWGVIRPWAGRAAALGLLALEGAGTTAGFFAHLHFEGWGLGLFEGLVAGALMHVVMYDALHGHAPASTPHHHDDHHGEHAKNPSEIEHIHGGHDEVHEPARGSAWERQAGVVGMFLGIATLLALGENHVTSASQFGQRFLTLALVSAPVLLLAFVGAGVLRSVLPSPTLGWLARGGSLSQAGRGLVFGVPQPVVACGVLPLYESLILTGAPATAALACLVATPELALDAVLLSLPLLGVELTLVRLAAAAVVALGIALLLGPRLRAASARSASESLARPPLRDRLRLGLRFGLGDLVDHSLPWVLLGLALAAAAAPLVADSGLAHLHPGLQIGVCALAGMPFYISATGATPLVAMLILQGVSPGAALAFLLTGPTVNTTALAVLRRVHGRGAPWIFALVLGLLAVGVGVGVHLLAPASPPVLGVATPESASLLQLLSLAALAALLLASLTRQGPRGAVSQITDPVDAS